MRSNKDYKCPGDFKIQARYFRQACIYREWDFNMELFVQGN